MKTLTGKPHSKKKSKAKYLKNLKKYKWTQWKASRLRSDWRTRAKKLELDPDKVPSRVEIQCWLEENMPFKCYLTDEPVIKSVVEMDHKVATSRGGSFDLHNVGITCKQLNAAKGGINEDEFRQLLKLISKWTDHGELLLRRLRASNNMFRRR